MIFSEALIMADELSKGGGSPSPERGSGVQIPATSTEMHESEGDFVHVDVSSREEREEQHEEEEQEEHESHLDMPAEREKSTFGILDLMSDEESPDEEEEEEEEEEEKSAFGMDLEEDEEHVLTLSEMHTHVEAIQDHNAPEQDVTDDAEDSVTEHADEAPEHDVTSAHETSGTTIIELPPAEDIDALEEDAQEEDLTEAVVEPQYEDEEDDSADAQEVAEQIALDEPHDQPAAT